MAIQDCEGKVLLTRRPKYMRKFPWAWVMPGGHIELGETLEQSVIREIHEETGIQIDQIKVNNTNEGKFQDTLCFYNDI